MHPMSDSKKKYVIINHQNHLCSILRCQGSDTSSNAQGVRVGELTLALLCQPKNCNSGHRLGCDISWSISKCLNVLEPCHENWLIKTPHFSHRKQVVEIECESDWTARQWSTRETRQSTVLSVSSSVHVLSLPQAEASFPYDPSCRNMFRSEVEKMIQTSYHVINASKRGDLQVSKQRSISTWYGAA